LKTKIKESINNHGTGNISSFLNKGLHECLALKTIIIIFEVIIAYVEFPPKIVPNCISE
jgi:hypothetical protein